MKFDTFKIDYLDDSDEFLVDFTSEKFDVCFICSSKNSISDILSFIELEWKEYQDYEISK